MLKNVRNTKTSFKTGVLQRLSGQSTLEYVVLGVVVTGALLSVSPFFKRSVMGGIKKSAEDIGGQFSPGNTNEIETTKVTGATKELVGQDEGGTAKQGTSSSSIQEKTPEITTTDRKTQIISVDEEYWGHTAAAAPAAAPAASGGAGQ